MQAAVRAVLERRYGDLTRLAYLALDDDQARPGNVLGAARATVRAAVQTPTQMATQAWVETSTDRRTPSPAPDEDYVRLRRRLVALLVEDPRAPSRLRFRIGFRRTPGPAQAGRTRAALRGLSPHQRLAYVLARVEGLAVTEVVAELDDHLAVTPDDVERTLAEVDAATGQDADEQGAELRAFDPTLVRLGPPRNLSRRGRVLAAVATAASLAAATVVYATWQQGPRPNDPALVPVSAWRQERTPDLSVWPTQGGRTQDLALLRRARGSWLRNRLNPPVGRLYVLYAGDLGDATTVIMRDSPGNRSGSLIAQYVERPLSRGVESVRQLGIGSVDLILLDALSNRFLVPPWRTSLRAAPLDRPRPEWRDLTVRGGVTDPLPWSWFAPRCQFYVAFQAADGMSSPKRTLTMLASHVSASATPGVTFRVPGPMRHDDTTLDRQTRWDAVRTLACAGGTSLQDSADLRVGQLWHGTLPGQGGHARIFTVERSGGAADQSDQALLVDEDNDAIGYGDSNSDYVLWANELAAAVWWWSSRSRRWYLIVAAAARVPRFYVLGELGRHEPRGRSIILRGPRTAPDIDRRPIVQVVVYEPDGDRSVISP